MPTHQSRVSLNNIDNIHQFEALFNFATIGIVVTNNTGQIINFNKYAETQFGYAKEEVFGDLVDILLPTSTHARHVKDREQYYHHPEPRIMGHGRDLLAQRKNGTTFPVEVSLSHYVINDEIFVFAFVIDITVRKAHEAMAMEQTRELERVTSEIKSMNTKLEQKVEDRTKMLREALSELERSKEELNLAYENERDLNELKSNFVTVASHEFRTPLSIILSSAYLLDKYNKLHGDPKVEKHVDRIKDAVGGMKNILEDFLSLGKLEEGLVQTNMELVSSVTLDDILKDLSQELDGLFKKGQKINLTNLVDGDVWLDTSLVKNILINLISNAIKFANENAIIKVISSINSNNLMISVEDNGIGISEEDQQHLFERFFRAKNAANIQGTGLGLHIVAKYLELMDGTITIKSTLNECTIFTFYIPQNKTGHGL
ncbi:MAG TPA: PAS domain-containing sensor histidine kinase [Chitinophagaceae bacterium]|nr:PAS domain-containing sensor histidine kinase [Chitinophagaceae bacterium]